MGLGAFNRMRRVEAMKAENVKKSQEEKIVETPVEEKPEKKQEIKQTLGPKKRKTTNKE